MKEDEEEVEAREGACSMATDISGSAAIPARECGALDDARFLSDREAEATAAGAKRLGAVPDGVFEGGAASGGIEQEGARSKAGHAMTC